MTNTEKYKSDEHITLTFPIWYATVNTTTAKIKIQLAAGHVGFAVFKYVMLFTLYAQPIEVTKAHPIFSYNLIIYQILMNFYHHLGMMD